jgi:hypothetical protein
MALDAAIIMALAAVLTAIGGIIVPIYTNKKSNTNTKLDEIIKDLEQIKLRNETINDIQNRAIKSITLSHLRQIHREAMAMTNYCQCTWANFNICYEAFRDLGGNGEANALKSDMDAKRSALVK